MAKEMTVYEELLATAAMKAPKDPNEQVFLIKLFKAINDLPEEEWEAMSEAAQKWSNAAAKAKTADKAYPKIPGAEVEPDEEADGDGAEAEDGEAPVAKKAAKKAPAKKAAAPAKKAAAAPAKKAAKKSGGEKPAKSMRKAAFEIICKAPHLTVDDIIGKLEGLGYEAAPVTISTFRSDARAVLKTAQEMKVDVSKMDFDK
jgi:hypothetical protein